MILTQTKKKLLVISNILLLSCNGQNQKQQSIQIEKNMELNNNVEQVLREQLRQGYSQSNDITDIAYVKFDKKSIKTSNFLLYEILKKEDYKISDTRFNDVIKNIFGNIKYDDSVYFIDRTKKCLQQSEIQLNDSDGFRNIVTIDKEFKMITNQYAIPEIINYKVKFPKISAEETKYPSINDDKDYITINKWKDRNDLVILIRKNQELMINRNFYLFKNDKSKLDWLLENDKEFLMSLVLEYGWLDDENLVLYTIKNVLNGNNNFEKFSQLFWNKNCEGTLRLNNKTYKNIEKNITSDTIRYSDLLDKISSFFDYINNEDTNIFNNLKPLEKTKVLSNLAYFAEQFKYSKDYNNRIMGKLRYFLTEKEEGLIIQNNYFELPKFKEWWDLAKSDEVYVKECLYGGTCGKDNPES